MDAASDDGAVRSFLGTLRTGDICTGVVTEVGRSRVMTVVLDGFPAGVVGRVEPLDPAWGPRGRERYEVGGRITAGVTAVDPDGGLVRLSVAAAEHPELWSFLQRCRRGDLLSGTVAAIESFGVFVALDDCPGHPVFPGVGFITIPELSWRRFEAVTDVVRPGDRVRCEFLQFDTWNGEARLSLRATEPDPFREFAAAVQVGQILPGTVTGLVPFGAFVRLADGIEGLVHLQELE